MGFFSFVICAENSIIYIHSYWNFLEMWKKICFTIVGGSTYYDQTQIVAQVIEDVK